MINEILGILSSIQAYVLNLVHVYGGFGVLVGMFLESSIVPIPSEAVLVTAGLIGINPLTVALYGGIGSTLGSIVGYYIGKKGGRPIINKIGPYFFITEEKVYRAEKKFQKYGGKAVFISRLIPFVPYKLFSITAGILRLNLLEFLAYTFVGSIFRCYLLAFIGEKIVQYNIWMLLIVTIIIIGAYFIFKKLLEKFHPMNFKKVQSKGEA